MIGHPLKVRELLDEIARGEVLLPEIQRAYVWKGPQVVKLLDSLYHEFPSGQILLWDTLELPVTKGLSGMEQTISSPGSRPKIVLDGQQRLTSLYQSLGRDSAGVHVYFNLDTKEFQRYSSRMKSEPLWVSVRAIINQEQHDLDILQRIEAVGGPGLGEPKSRTYLDRLQQLKKIGEYKYPIEIFRSDDYAAVTELFVRINSSGTRLQAAELVLAQLALRLPGALVDTLEHALNEYEDIGYELDTRFLIPALIAVGTGQSRYRYLSEFWTKSADEISRIWKSTKKGIDSAVNFVRQNARFESSEWLPSLQPLITLAYFFGRRRCVTVGRLHRSLPPGPNSVNDSPKADKYVQIEPIHETVDSWEIRRNKEVFGPVIGPRGKTQVAAGMHRRDFVFSRKVSVPLWTSTRLVDQQYPGSCPF